MDQYRKAPGVSQSTLKCVVKNDFSVPSGTNVGSLVDSILYLKTTEPYRVCEIPDKYLIALQSKDPLGKIRELGHYPNWTDETHLSNLKKHSEAFNELGDKTPVSKKDWDLAHEIVEIIEKDPIWIQKKNGLYQVPLFGEISGVKIKGLLDQLHIEEKVIRDLKVTDAKLSEWQYIAKRLMYPFQASFYKELVRQNYYTECNFEWLVYSIPEKRMACFIASEKDLEVGEYGNAYTKGWREALDIYKKCKNKADYYLPFYEGNGCIKTNIY